MQCSHCGSSNVVKAGFTVSGYQRIKCKDCTRYTSLTDYDQPGIQEVKAVKMASKRYIITSAINNRPLHQEFIRNLETLADTIDAEILCIKQENTGKKFITPVPADESEFEEDNFVWWDEWVEDHSLVHPRIELSDYLQIAEDIKLSPTLANPIAGLDPHTKAKISTIFGHQEYAYTNVPHDPNAFQPVWMTTTGSANDPQNFFMDTKAAAKSAHYFCLGAVVVSVDPLSGDHFMSQVHADIDGSFYFMDKAFSEGIFVDGIRAAGLVVGDEHVRNAELAALEGTFISDDSMTNVFNPEVIVRHDILDFASASHHHNVLDKYRKHFEQESSVHAEIQELVDYIIGTTPEDSKSIIVSSNHNDHLERWFTEFDWKTDPENSLFWFELGAQLLQKTSEGDHPIALEEAFALIQKVPSNVEFLNRNDVARVAGVRVDLHGDKGMNGSRGSIPQFAKVYEPVVVGHSHKPMWRKNAVSVGCVVKKDISYTWGSPASEWSHTNCVIYPNGKRGLFSINLEGKWWK